MTEPTIVAELWTVTATYVVDGRLVCDLVRMGVGARSLTAIPVAQMGGGPTRSLVMPPTPGVRPPNGSPGSQFDPAVNQGAQVLVVYMQPDPWTAPRPVIIGTIGHTSSGLASNTNAASTVRIENAGASIALDQDGEIIVTPNDGKSASVVLSQQGVMTISRDGAAGDYAVLAEPMASAYNALQAEVSTLRAELSTVVATLNTLLVTPLPPLSPVEPVPQIAVTDIGADVLRLAADRPQG